MEDIEEKFKGLLWKQGDSMVITIPSNFIKFGDYREGDIIEVKFKKVY